MEDRWYQDESVAALMGYLADSTGHPVVVAPTGSGKTAILCKFINSFLSLYPTANVLVLSHVKEILYQDHKSLTDYFDGYEIGLFSAGLGSKTINKITVAGIQSAHRTPDEFAGFGIIIIDECHLITVKQNGMYRKFLSRIEAWRDYVPSIGLTATPFRLGHGYIYEGEGALFTDVVYDLSSYDNFNRLVSEGFLSKLITPTTELKLSVEGVRTQAGDFKASDLSDNIDRATITNDAVAETIKFGKNYKRWLVFAIDIEHADHITHTLNLNGIPAIAIHSKMEGDRTIELAASKKGKYRAIISVGVLTTGYDDPEIDLIVILSPTKSPVKHVQTIGRGLRVHPGKDHCLVLDFAGNTARLGPINDIKIRSKVKGCGGEPIIKHCPDCSCIQHPSARVCDVCGFKFKFKESIISTSSVDEVVRVQVEGWVDVDGVSYAIHKKKNSRDTLKVTYMCGIKSISEWICYDHEGWPKHVAIAWVKYRIEGEMPTDVPDLFLRVGDLRVPSKIFINTAEKFTKILKADFDNKVDV